MEKRLFYMNIWHRVYPVLCSVHSVVLHQFAIFLTVEMVYNLKH